jgi:GTP-binding protein EngB required for normal cell division
MKSLDREIIQSIEEIKKEILLLLNKIDDYEIKIINENTKNEMKLDKQKILLENIILEYHTVCQNLYKEN